MNSNVLLTDNSLVSSLLGWESQAYRESREGMAVIQEVATTFLREKLEQLGDTGDNEKVRHHLALLMTLKVSELKTKLFK